MPMELRMLAYTVLLGWVQLIVAAQATTGQRGIKWNLSARDEKKADLIGVAGRLDRAFKNFLETFPFFLAAVFLVQVLNRNNATTALGAQIYFYARVLYVPLYAFAVPFVRTLVWFAATVGIFMVFTAALNN